MPKYGIHHIILQHAIEKKLLTSDDPASQSAGALLEDHRDAAMLGAIGPDLFFFAPDYPAMPAVIALYKNFKKALDVWDDINRGIDKINEVVVEPVDAQVKDAVGEENVLIIQLLLEELGKTTDLFASLVKTGLLAGVVGGSKSVFDAAGVNLVQGFFNLLFTPGLQVNAPVQSWQWFDLLHYSRTGGFARRLLQNAVTPRQRAYALGYLSHIAADVTGHAYVNQIVGAPYRRNVQRHVTAENFMDTWAFDHYFQESVNSTLLERLGITDQSCTDDIAQLLVTTLQQVPPNESWPSGMEKPVLSTAEIKDTYVTFHGLLSIMTRMGVERPKEPFPAVLALLEKAWQDIFQPPPAPPATPDSNCTWQDMLGVTSNSGACWTSLAENVGAWLEYLASLADWLVDRVKELVDFLLTALLSLPVTVLLAILYAIQLTLFQLYRMAHWSLSMQGLIMPLRDDLSNAVAQQLVRADFACLPQLADGQGFPSVATRYPQVTQFGDSHLLCPIRGSEDQNRLWNFLTLGAPFDPQQFIEALPFSKDNLSAYAAATTPDVIFGLQREGRAIGNAIDLTAWMIATASDPAASQDDRDVCFTDWNLDADRGYGYKVWEGKVEEPMVIDGMMQSAAVSNEKLAAVT